VFIVSSGYSLQQLETKVSVHVHAVLSQNRNSIVLVFDEMLLSVSHNSGPILLERLALLARQLTIWQSPSVVVFPGPVAGPEKKPGLDQTGPPATGPSVAVAVATGYQLSSTKKYDEPHQNRLQSVRFLIFNSI
jgi:hypothetical protein